MTFDDYAHRVVAADVRVERVRQHIKFGQVDHPNGTGELRDIRTLHDFRAHLAAGESGTHESFRSVLEEEVLEAFAEGDPEKLRAELVQVAATAQAWIEKLDRELKTEAKYAQIYRATVV